MYLFYKDSKKKYEIKPNFQISISFEYRMCKQRLISKVLLYQDLIFSQPNEIRGRESSTFSFSYVLSEFTSKNIYLRTNFSTKHLIFEWLTYGLLMLEKCQLDVQAL